MQCKGTYSSEDEMTVPVTGILPKHQVFVQTSENMSAFLFHIYYDVNTHSSTLNPQRCPSVKWLYRLNKI